MLAAVVALAMVPAVAVSGCGGTGEVEALEDPSQESAATLPSDSKDSVEGPLEARGYAKTDDSERSPEMVAFGTGPAERAVSFKKGELTIIVYDFEDANSAKKAATVFAEVDGLVPETLGVGQRLIVALPDEGTPAADTRRELQAIADALGPKVEVIG